MALISPKPWYWRNISAWARTLIRGYADQAHLTRDFTDTIGVPPAQYAASVSAGG